MKKTFLGMLLALMMAFVMAFAGCGIGQGDADKVNEAVKAGESMTIEEVEKEFGEPTYKAVGEVIKTGIMVWVNGCDDLEDIQERWDDGKTVEGLYVVITLGYATLADYREISAEDFND